MPDNAAPVAGKRQQRQDELEQPHGEERPTVRPRARRDDDSPAQKKLVLILRCREHYI